MLSDMHLIVLREIRRQRVATFDSISEPMRQKVIDLGMMEPPLVDCIGPALFITTQGEKALLAAGMLN